MELTFLSVRVKNNYALKCQLCCKPFSKTKIRQLHFASYIPGKFRKHNIFCFRHQDSARQWRKVYTTHPTYGVYVYVYVFRLYIVQNIGNKIKPPTVNSGHFLGLALSAVGVVGGWRARRWEENRGTRSLVLMAGPGLEGGRGAGG